MYQKAPIYKAKARSPAAAAPNTMLAVLESAPLVLIGALGK
jgi:hypothetical protein